MNVFVHVAHWFEIPVDDFARAHAFYSALYDMDLPCLQQDDKQMAFLPFEQGKGIGGALVKQEGFHPGGRGPLIYLAAGNNLIHMLMRVEAAGGKILQSKTKINEQIGYIAIFTDSEGNRLGLHSSV